MTSSPPRKSSTTPADAQLIEGCRYCLSQCDALLQQLEPADFVICSSGSSVGAHLRHVLERFQSFFAGLPAGHIDYDARERDATLETDLEAAALTLAALTAQVEALDLASHGHSGINVHESVYHEGPAVTIRSTPAREIMGLITHSTHHLAIIALLIKPLGYRLDSNFGKAPSTMLYERQR